MARPPFLSTFQARVALVLGTIVVVGVAATPLLYRKDLATAVRHRDASWTQSGTCQSCHPDHFASWERTFHRTMTQEATPDTVVGAFDGKPITLWGMTARPVQRDGQFLVEYLDARGSVTKTLHVRRTVGSRRYQQYLVGERRDGVENYYRIPLLWHIGERRWIHLNGAFLGNDQRGYDSYLALWNPNCIFCHNTGPRPGSLNYDQLQTRARRGEKVNWEFDGEYRSAVAELGIACESCHAPAGEHTERNRSPLRRYLLHLTGQEDPSIVNPARLSKERSVDVCGQCHGQRLANPPGSIREWMHDGPVYRAGEVLTDSVRPLTRDVPGPPWDPDLVRHRFWDDGTPRLTAYEYQGITMSACFQKGELTCLSCHDMHGGDVRGQIQPAMRTNEACRGCHAALVENVGQHSHHDPKGAGASCYECHMPRAVYGILEVHRSHRIENPDPARDAEAARPNACTSCHLDRSATWAAEASRTWWGEEYRTPASRGDGAPVDAPAFVAELLAGDPVQRAVAARLAGRRDTPLTVEARAAFVAPLLLQGLADNYPAIRWFARSSLADLAEELGDARLRQLALDFDYIADAPARTVARAAIEQRWAATRSEADRPLPAPPPGALVSNDHQLDTTAVAALTALRATSEKEIDIGE